MAFLVEFMMTLTETSKSFDVRYKPKNHIMSEKKTYKACSITFLSSLQLAHVQCCVSIKDVVWPAWPKNFQFFPKFNFPWHKFVSPESKKFSTNYKKKSGSRNLLYEFLKFPKMQFPRPFENHNNLKNS